MNPAKTIIDTKGAGMADPSQKRATLPTDAALREYLAEPRTVREVADYLRISHPTARKRIIAASAMKVTGTRPVQWVLNNIEAVAREARIAAEGQDMPTVGEAMAGARVDSVALHADGTLGVSGHIAKPTPTALATAAWGERTALTATLAKAFGIAAGTMTFEQVVEVAARRLHMAREGQTAAQELNATLRKKLGDGGEDIARMRGDLEAMRKHLGQGDDVELGALPGLLRARLVADAGQYGHVRRLLAQERSKANDRQDDLAGLHSTTSATVDRIKELTGQDTLAAALDYLRGMKRMAHGFEQVRDVLFRGWPSSVERAGYSVQRTAHQAETMVALAQGLDRIRDVLFPMSGGVHVDTVVAKVVALATRPEAGDETGQRLADMEQRNRRLEARVRGLLKVIETLAEGAADDGRSA